MTRICIGDAFDILSHLGLSKSLKADAKSYFSPGKIPLSLTILILLNVEQDSGTACHSTLLVVDVLLIGSSFYSEAGGWGGGLKVIALPVLDKKVHTAPLMLSGVKCSPPAGRRRTWNFLQMPKHIHPNLIYLLKTVKWGRGCMKNVEKKTQKTWKMFETTNREKNNLTQTHRLPAELWPWEHLLHMGTFALWCWLQSSSCGKYNTTFSK